MKALLVIADGMADRPDKELGWKTPLESARKPSLDWIARTGVCGIIDPISPGVPAGSDTAMLSLFGYDALKIYSGRGALEALGSGLKVFPGDVAFRCNFATVDKNMIVTDRRAGRIPNEAASKLAKSLQKIRLKESDVDFLFKNTVQHRAVLKLHGGKLSTAVTETDPAETGKRILKAKPLNDTAEAKRTAGLLNEITGKFHGVLQDHPLNKERAKQGLAVANMVLCRGAGTVPKIKPLSDVYDIKVACVAAVPLVKGVCMLAGMKMFHVKGATGTLDTDYSAKGKAAVQALKDHGLVVLHVKATDIASHDRKPKLKTEVIEKIDVMLGSVLDKIDMDSTYVAVTADHTTSVVTGRHEGEPVPIAITGQYVRRDDVREYGERTCARGGLGRIRGMELMPILMNLLGKTKQFGA